MGDSIVDNIFYATEWSNGSVINLGALPGSTYSIPTSINDAGQVVGFSEIGSGFYATEWSNGSVINLGSLPDLRGSTANDINNAGQIVGSSGGIIPEPSTWAMMLLGFAGLGYVGYRRAKRASFQPL